MCKYFCNFASFFTKLTIQTISNAQKRIKSKKTMSSVNKAILIGNVGSEPEVRYLDRGVCIVNFNLATTERGYTMQNGVQVPDKTDWHNIVLFRNLAEWAERYIRKGMKIYVEGKIQTRSWEKDGQMRHKTEIVGENIQILYRPDYLRQEQQNRQQADAAIEADSDQALDGMSDDDNIF